MIGILYLCSKIVTKLKMDKKNISSEDKEKAREFYNLGAEAWKNGDMAKAMTLYAESAELDPEGPGAKALEMANEIMSFFDPNQLNP